MYPMKYYSAIYTFLQWHLVLEDVLDHEGKDGEEMRELDLTVISKELSF